MGSLVDVSVNIELWRFIFCLVFWWDIVILEFKSSFRRKGGF